MRDPRVSPLHAVVQGAPPPWTLSPRPGPPAPGRRPGAQLCDSHARARLLPQCLPHTQRAPRSRLLPSQGSTGTKRGKVLWPQTGQKSNPSKERYAMAASQGQRQNQKDQLPSSRTRCTCAHCSPVQWTGVLRLFWNCARVEPSVRFPPRNHGQGNLVCSRAKC